MSLKGKWRSGFLKFPRCGKRDTGNPESHPGWELLPGPGSQCNGFGRAGIARICPTGEHGPWCVTTVQRLFRLAPRETSAARVCQSIERHQTKQIKMQAFMFPLLIKKLEIVTTLVSILWDNDSYTVNGNMYQTFSIHTLSNNPNPRFVS